ncbi:hypothetical protein PTKIN_Ptkin10aG0038000 [Pterospermum kingtungense]
MEPGMCALIETSAFFMAWQEALPVGILKFNVDGAARGCPRPASIEGILRDSSHKVLGNFNKSVDIVDSNLTKLLAVKEAIGIFSASQWVDSHCMVIESDSANVVKWVRYPNTVP